MPEADASLETLLGRLGLKKHLPTFVEEELDVALLKSMGVHLKQSVVGLGLRAVEADRLVAAVNGDESVCEWRRECLCARRVAPRGEWR